MPDINPDTHRAKSACPVPKVGFLRTQSSFRSFVYIFKSSEYINRTFVFTLCAGETNFRSGLVGLWVRLDAILCLPVRGFASDAGGLDVWSMSLLPLGVMRAECLGVAPRGVGEEAHCPLPVGKCKAAMTLGVECLQSVSLCILKEGWDAAAAFILFAVWRH